MLVLDPIDITLEQTEDGTEVIVNVTGDVKPDFDFIVLVDASVVREDVPETTEHYFAARKYTAGTWPVAGDTFNLVISPALGDNDNVDVKAYAAYNVNITNP